MLTKIIICTVNLQIFAEAINNKECYQIRLIRGGR
jgi:hypothetical protein